MRIYLRCEHRGRCEWEVESRCPSGLLHRHLVHLRVNWQKCEWGGVNEEVGYESMIYNTILYNVSSGMVAVEVWIGRCETTRCYTIVPPA